MSKLLISWVNTDVGLSREVTDLDDDFKDGYLLGELLSKYKQQSDFSLFSPKGTNDAKINNFRRLEPTMRTLGIFFNSRVASDIMDGKAGTMKTLLFELKTSLDSFHRGVRRPTEKKLVQVIAIEKPKYNKTMAQTFDNAIRTSVTNGNRQSHSAAAEVSGALDLKTEEFHTALAAGHADDMDVYVSDVQRAKQLSQQRKLHEKEFMRAWDEKNTQQWKTNLARGKARREKEMHDSMQRTNTIKSARLQNSKEHRESALAGIGEFEETLKREMLKNDSTEESGSSQVSAMFMTAGGQPGTGVPCLTYMDPSVLQAGLVHTQKTLKERHEDMVVRQQLHMRRRKRFVREKEAHQAQQLYSTVERDIADQLLSLNRSEAVERLARSRVLIHSDLMKENARNRAARAASLTAEFTEKERIWKQLQASREVRWVVQPRIAAQARRQARLEASAAAAISCDTHEFISSLVDRVLDVADWVACCRAMGYFSSDDGALLPSELLADALSMCAQSDLPVPPALALPERCNVFDQLPFSLCARPACSDQTWIAASPFTGRAIMSVGNDAGAAAVALARRDAAGFIADVALTDLPGGDKIIPSRDPAFNSLSEPVAEAKDSKAVAKKGAKEEPVVEAAPSPPPYIPKTKTLVTNPDWLFETPARNLLGGVIVQCRTSANPLQAIPSVAIPEEKEFLPDPPLPAVLRFALCGPSDSLRSKLAAALCRQLAPTEVAIINVHELIKSLSQVETENAILAGLSDETAETLRRMVFTNVSTGGEILDVTYVSIISACILSLPATSGYILEDFPNTVEQARLLMLSLTGLDRTIMRPQPNDRASDFLPVKEAEFVDYDKALSVFDGVIQVSATDPSEPYEFRVRCRRNLRNGSIVVVGDDCSSVEALSDLFTPDMPHELLSVSLKLSGDDQPELESFWGALNVLKSSIIPSHDEDVIEQAAAAVIAALPQRDTSAQVEGDEEPVEDHTTQAEDATQARASVEESTPAEHVQPALAVVVRHVAGSVNRQVAKSLVHFWEVAEKQSVCETERFFETIRDVRYRMVQRRRCFADALSKCSNRRDSKQALWDDFVTSFNSFDEDFRYDPDLRAELHLRALELRAQFYAMAESRRKVLEETRVKILGDGAVGVAVHFVQGSASVLIQSEINRFKTGITVIQDYIKSAAAYKYTSEVTSILEEYAVPAEDMYDATASEATLGAATGKDGKAAAKPKVGGKGDAKALRFSIAPILLNKAALVAVPEPEPLEVEEAPAAKGKAPAAKKGGKGKEETTVVVSPLSSVEQSALALAEYYSQGNFTAARDVYEGNDCMADVIESAVWHEAARLKFAVGKIKVFVTDVETWLAQYEKEAGEVIQKFVHKRYLHELACTEAVVARVIRAVEDFSPIREQWLLANDAVSVMSDSLILPLPAHHPDACVAEFPSNRLNTEQLDLVNDSLSRLNLGGLVLLEDVETWLQKSSLPGAPPGNTYSSIDSGTFQTHLRSLLLPVMLVEHQSQVSVSISASMNETQFADSGVCPVAIIARTMAETVILLPDPADSGPTEEAESAGSDKLFPVSDQIDAEAVP